MGIQWIRELWLWWGALTPDMMFLFALPFVVAAASFLAPVLERRVRR